MIVPRYYEDLEILHDNTMPARAYYIPASKKMDDLIEHRETSDRFQLLDKNWKFQYFESILLEQNIFYETPQYESEVKYPLQLQEGECFVLGDHREGATDSRYFGAVDTQEIRGKIITVIRRNQL